MKKIFLFFSILCLFSSINSYAAKIDINIENSHGEQHVTASFMVNASSNVARNVLTDYNNLPKFISSLTLSRILSSTIAASGFNYDTAKYLVVEQEGIGHAFLFKKHIYVKLAIEEYENSIILEDVSRKDFWFYDGYWIVFSRGPQSLIIYKLISKPRFKVPFSNHVEKKNILKLLSEVEKEMLRRSKL